MQKVKISFIVIGTLMLLASVLPNGVAVPSNPAAPGLLNIPEIRHETWQAGDVSAYYTISDVYSGSRLLSYNGSDAVRSVKFSRNSDYSAPFINYTSETNKWFAVWNNDPAVYLNLTLESTPSYTPFDLTTRYPTTVQLQLGGNLDIQTAHWQYNLESTALCDAASYVLLFYKVSLTAGHFYTVKLGNRDWEPINTSATYPNVDLLVFPAPVDNAAQFYDPMAMFPQNFIVGNMVTFMGGVYYYFAATGIHPQTTQDYYVVAVQRYSNNKWIPQQLLIQDEENVWEDFLAANPWFYFFPQVNPWLFLAAVGGIAAVVVFVVTRKINKSKLKAPASTGAKEEFLDEL